MNKKIYPQQIINNYVSLENKYFCQCIKLVSIKINITFYFSIFQN